MEILKNILYVIKDLPVIGKVLSVIIILLLSIVLIFYTNGCALHFDSLHMDNLTTSGVKK